MYELVSNPKQFKYTECLDAIDLALSADTANTQELISLLQDDAPELRYWGATGLLF